LLKMSARGQGKVDLDVNELFTFLMTNDTIRPVNIVFTEYDSVYSPHQLIIIIAGLLIAMVILLLRYTLHNTEKVESKTEPQPQA